MTSAFSGTSTYQTSAGRKIYRSLEIWQHIHLCNLIFSYDRSTSLLCTVLGMCIVHMPSYLEQPGYLKGHWIEGIHYFRRSSGKGVWKNSCSPEKEARSHIFKNTQIPRKAKIWAWKGNLSDCWTSQKWRSLSARDTVLEGSPELTVV